MLVLQASSPSTACGPARFLPSVPFDPHSYCFSLGTYDLFLLKWISSRSESQFDRLSRCERSFLLLRQRHATHHPRDSPHIAAVRPTRRCSDDRFVVFPVSPL